MSDTGTGLGHVRLVRELSNGLAVYLRSLSNDVWRDPERYPSGCSQWKVADVVAHLNWKAHDAALSIQRALKSDVSPPMGYTPVGKDEEAERIVTARIAYDEDLFPEFNVGCRRLNTLLASLGPEHSDLHAWHLGSEAPLSRLVEYRASELAIHGWDVRYGINKTAGLDEMSREFLMEGLPDRLMYTFHGASDMTGRTRYRFQLAAERYDVVISPDGCDVQHSADETPDVTFTCDVDTYILFAIGRLPFARSVRRGRLSFEGDEASASQFPEWFGP